MMPTLEQVTTLPHLHRRTIPEDYLDVMGHMNVRWYISIFDDSAWDLFSGFGMDEAYYKTSNSGSFALRQCISYLAEVGVGETVSVYARAIGHNAKRVHFMLYMVNESRNNIAATMETLGSHADLVARRTSPFPEHIAANLSQLVNDHKALGWESTLSGAIQL